MKVVTIATTDLRRLLHWRANIFFLFVLPMLLILLLGAAFGASEKARIGVLGANEGRLARQFVAALGARPSTELHRYTSADALQQAVARGRVDAGLEFPAGYDARLQQGRGVTIGYFARPNSVAQQLRVTVRRSAPNRVARSPLHRSSNGI